MSESRLATQPAKAAAERGRATLQFATFFLNGQLFGIQILHVQEILLRQNVTPVPHAPDYVMGLIGLRGQIVTAVDLRKRLGLSERAQVEEPYHLVVSANGGVASLQVDGVGDVLEMPESQLLPPPESLEGIDPTFIQGVFMLEERILAIIDVQAVLATA
jgi:purine-binding chemotaxis protein CheW